MLPATSTLCSNCGTPLAPDALKCASCGRLTHVQEFEALAQHAKLAGQAGDWHGAKLAWEKALPLLPPDSGEYRTAKARIDNINLQLSDKNVWAKRAAKLGPAGVVLWKFKTIALLVLTKAKLVLLGLTKLSTFLSMLTFFAVYWSMFGWKFALGFVMSIYVHEMGHVIALRKYGIAATSPMFIPFVGALVRMKQYPANVGEDARVGLAGPIWGLGATVVAWLGGVATGLPIWYAIAHTSAWLNLFNLLPIWQLDGGRGFRALTRKQRGMALGAALAMWVMTQQTMLLLISGGAIYRLFSKDYAAEDDNSVLTQYIGLIVLLSLLVQMTARAVPSY
ncbi:MAG TPA: site-2 protease family protein [Bryobacteraceae bacterium]|nr:site-2 protease family protein [Bryobacteraceae bacterium]